MVQTVCENGAFCHSKSQLVIVSQGVYEGGKSNSGERYYFADLILSLELNLG